MKFNTMSPLETIIQVLKIILAVVAIGVIWYYIKDIDIIVIA
jgi:hypothetical protein